MKRSTPMGAPDPLVAVADILRSHGVEGCGVRAAGNDGEVLLLRPRDAAAEAALTSGGLLEALCAAGFRYVALDLAPAGAEDQG